MSAEVMNPPPASTSNTINPVDGPRITFPPFPQIPDGVQITPFKDFREGGIAMQPGPDDAEVDSRGIPTVPLLKVRHTTDVCKTNTKRKRRAEEAVARKKGGLPVKKIPWWEQWEDTEAARFSVGFDRHSSRYERIHAAAADFRQGRMWPVDYMSETGPKFIYDRFLRYIGLPDGAAVPGEKKQKLAKEQAKLDEEDMSDDNMDVPEDDAPNDDPMAAIVLDRKIPEIVKEHTRKITNDEKLHLFFEDPYKSIKIFLSSYAMEQGYIWYDANLECMGRILGFFVNFLLRSKVLPEFERPFRRSLEVITKSVAELPNIPPLSKKLPDDFSQGCVSCWGRKSQSFTIITVDIPKPSEEAPKAALVVHDKTDDKNEGWNAAAEEPSGWGASSSWNTQNASGGGWGDAVDPSVEVNTWGEPVETKEDEESWDVEEKSLLSLMGPTALPITHAPGIVEQSMRRIKAIIPLSPNPPKSPPLGEGIFDPDAEAVENELERRFTKIVLEPMVDWDGGESPVYRRPVILPTSVGAVVGPDTPEVSDGGVKPFDPFKDDITLLVETIPEQISLMCEGMGMAGVWVQIARQGDGTVVKKKKKGKSKKTIPSYWYMETLATTVASFWTIAS